MAIKRAVEPKSRPIRAAIYARVSTVEQKTDMQLTELFQYADRMGWEWIEYTEKASSVKKRPVLDRLMADARLRKIDVILVWKLDRFARSLQQLSTNLQLLDQFGVRFICATQGIDTDKRNPASRLMLNMLGAFAEFERDIIIERVTAGVQEYAAAYKAGKVGKTVHSKSGKDLAPHRPKRIFHRAKAAELRAGGMSFRKIAAQLGVPLTTVTRAIKAK